MNNPTNLNAPIGGHAPAAASAAIAADAPHAFTLIASPAGFGPLVPASSPSAYHCIPLREAARDMNAPRLLDGFGRLMRFLLDEEVNYLCGVPHKSRSPQRINFRGGFRERKLRTNIGTIPIRVPLLRYMHPRVSIVKRAKRLSSGILEQLARIHAAGVSADDAAALIKTLWTVPVPDAQLASLATKLAPILEEWRVNTSTPPARQDDELQNDPNADANETDTNETPLDILPPATTATVLCAV